MTQTIIETLQSVDIPITTNSYAGTWIDAVEGADATVQVIRSGSNTTPQLPVQLLDGDTLRVTRTAPDSDVPSRLVGRPGPNWRSVPDTTGATAGEVLTIASDGTLDWAAPSGGTGGTGTPGADGQDGVGITSITQIGNELTVNLTDGSTQGPFVLPAGPKGDTGDTGTAGAQGVSVTNAQINDQGHLIITLSNGQTIDAGVAQGTNSSGATTLDALTDVNTAGAVSGRVLGFNGTEWVPVEVASGGGGGGSSLPAGGAANKFVGHDGNNPMWLNVNLSSQGNVLVQSKGSDQIPQGAALGGTVVTVGANPVPITGFTLRLDGNRTPTGHKAVIVRLDSANKIVDIVRSSSVMPTTSGPISFKADFPATVLAANTKYVLGIESTGNGNNDARYMLGLVTGSGAIGSGLTQTAWSNSHTYPLAVGQSVNITSNTWWPIITIHNDAPGVGKNVSGPLDATDLPEYNAAGNGTFLSKTANGPVWSSPFPAATANNQVIAWNGFNWIAQHPLTTAYPNQSRSFSIRSADQSATPLALNNTDKGRLVVFQNFDCTVTYTGRTRIRVYDTSAKATSDWARAYGTNPGNNRPVLEIVLEDGVKYASTGETVFNNTQVLLYATVQVIGATGMSSSGADCTLTYHVI